MKLTKGLENKSYEEPREEEDKGKPHHYLTTTWKPEWRLHEGECWSLLSGAKW